MTTGNDLTVVQVKDRTLSAESKYAKHLKKQTQELDQSFKVQLEQFVDHLYMQIFIFILILIDIILAFTTDENHALVVTIIILVIFFIEIGARVYAYGIHRWIRSCIDVFDFLIVLLSLIVTAIQLHQYSGFVLIARTSRILRILRFARFFTRVFKSARSAPKSIRSVVRQNKQGYRDEKYSLDLVYITDRVIAMSIPGDGARALFRNPSSKVAEFLNEKHPESYLIFNLCMEQTYNAAAFDGRVRNFVFEDHSVPTPRQILEVSQEVETFLEKDDNNVVVIHCRGGKGRTGTIVCSVLLERYRKSTPEDVLLHFEEMRTNYFGAKKQGLSTPSQERYVRYFYDLIRRSDIKTVFNYPVHWQLDLIKMGPVYHHPTKILWEIRISCVDEDGKKEETEHLFKLKRLDGMDTELMKLYEESKLDEENEVNTIRSYDTALSVMDDEDTADLRLETLQFYPEFGKAIRLAGNVRFQIYRYSAKKKKKWANVWLNSTLSDVDDNGYVSVPKLRVDKLHKDVKNKKAGGDFTFRVRVDSSKDLAAFEQERFGGGDVGYKPSMSAISVGQEVQLGHA